MKKASSKGIPDEDAGESIEDNPEAIFGLSLPSGVWRTNLLLEGE